MRSGDGFTSPGLTFTITLVYHQPIFVNFIPQFGLPTSRADELYFADALSRFFVPYCSVIFCEAVAIYGIIIAIIFASKLTDSGKAPTDLDYFSGFALFFSGLTVGVVNLFCGFVILTQRPQLRPPMLTLASLA
jgi:F0F1-type ATP synthase membrane subunit c/vacuolar-type H+-ATPase subunit K